MINFLRTNPKLKVLLFLFVICFSFFYTNPVFATDEENENVAMRNAGTLASRVSGYDGSGNFFKENEVNYDAMGEYGSLTIYGKLLNENKSEADARAAAISAHAEIYNSTIDNFRGIVIYNTPETGETLTDNDRIESNKLNAQNLVIVNNIRKKLNFDKSITSQGDKVTENLQRDKPRSEPVVCSFDSPLQTTLLGCVALSVYSLLSVFVWIFGLIAMLFNYVITYTLNMSSLVSKITIVDIGWTAIRDIINLSFIFLVLYAAINTIIGNSDYGIKKMLSKIIIAAVLINFSLFFTQVMIDVSNVFALTFYNKITNNVGVSSSTSVSGISATISHAIGIDSLLTWSQKGATSVNLDALSIIEYSIGSIIFLCITIFVLGAGALMLIARALTLIFLMMASPIAFISGVLPQAKDVAGKWWKSLTANLMFAPMYMAFIYLVVLMATNLNGKYNLIDVFSDKGDWEKVLATLFNMIILNGMMAASLGVAISMGDSSTKTAVGWANKGRDWISAKATNNTIGRVAAGISTNQGLQRMVARGGALGMVGTGILKSSRFASTGFTKAVDAAEKRKLEFNNSLSKEKVVTDKAERDAQGNFIEDLSSDTFGEINGVRTRIKMKKLDSAREIMLKTSVRRGKSRFSSRATRKVAAQAQIDKNKDDIEDEQKKRNELNEQRKVIDDQISIWNKTNVGQPTDPTLLAKKQEISDEIGKINKKIKELQNDNGVKRAKIVTARGGANRLGSSSIRV